jgi:DNA-binding MarR family transcriptional regulator
MPASPMRSASCRGAETVGEPVAAADAALDTSAIDHLLGFRLALAEVGTRRVFQHHIGAPFELRPVEFTVLLLLRGNPGATPKRLARTLRLSPPNVTVLVDRLAARELVQRERSPDDGRATILRLTGHGADLAQRAWSASRTMEAGLLKALTPGERALLGELLNKLALTA